MKKNNTLIYIAIFIISAIPELFYAQNQNDNKSTIVLPNFVETSKKVMDAVVNIQSTQNMRYAQQGRGQFPFDEELFRYFFGPDQMPNENELRRAPQQKVGVGSGVIIKPDGYIVTNNHVVENAVELAVTLRDNRTYKGEVIGTDPSTDLALIKIKETNLPTIPIANSNESQIGEWVLAVGNPYGLTSTVTMGIISAKSRSLNILSSKNPIESFIQTDAAINPGNSGGALVNMNGELIGVNTAIASPTGSYSGYGFAISSNLVKKVADDIIQFGEVRRGYLGILMHNITGKFAAEKNLKINQGAFVDSVVADGAAAKAGIKSGDIITGVNGTIIRQSSELQEMIAELHPGDKVSITVNRNGEEQAFNAVLKGAETTTTALAKERKSKIESILGADLRTVDQSLSQKLKIPGGIKIEKLYPGKLSSSTDIREGFIITKVFDQPVKSLEDLQKAIDNRTGNGVMIEGVYENAAGTFYYAFGL